MITDAAGFLGTQLYFTLSSTHQYTACLLDMSARNTAALDFIPNLSDGLILHCHQNLQSFSDSEAKENGNRIWKQQSVLIVEYSTQQKPFSTAVYRHTR